MSKENEPSDSIYFQNNVFY